MRYESGDLPYLENRRFSLCVYYHKTRQKSSLFIFPPTGVYILYTLMGRCFFMGNWITLHEPAGLLALNETTAAYGLLLTPAQAMELAAMQECALSDTGRIEFGEGAAARLARALCASPYVDRATWADTLAEMTALFYALKSETHDALSDSELIDAMVRVFDGRAHGAVQVLADMTEGDWLHEVCDHGDGEEAADDEADE